MQPLALIHHFTHLRSLGGVESILHRHLVADEANRLASRFVVFFEGGHSDVSRVSGLNWNGCTTIRQARHSFARQAANPPPDVALYHNLWGIPFLAEFDAAHRRLGMLHSDWPGLEENLHAHRGLLDGALCVSEALRAIVLRHLPELEPWRVEAIPCPITNYPPAPPRAPRAPRKLVLGYCGRVVIRQKRVDRFPPLARFLEGAGLDFRLEFLGDGAQENWLRRQFKRRANVVFHGRKSGADCRKIMEEWDAIIFTSDYEGLPIALVEALNAGVLPFFPQINSGGDQLVREIHPDFLYPPGDLAALTRALVESQRCPEVEVQALRLRCREKTAPHWSESYLERFAAFVHRINAAPRVSLPATRSRMFHMADCLPFGVLRRVYPQGFWRT